MALGMPKIDTNGYCGPSAVSVVTGVFTSDAAMIMREISGRRKITGCESLLLIETLEYFDWPCREIEIARHGHRVTVRELLQRLDMPGPWRWPAIVRITNHYVVTDGRDWIDNSRAEPGDVLHRNGPGRCIVKGIILHT